MCARLCAAPAALLVLALFLPGTILADDFPDRSIPGVWDAFGHSVDPGGVLPPFGADVIRRPALAIQPLTGDPAVVVHRQGLLQLLGITQWGALMRIDAATGAATQISDIEFNECAALAFDSHSESVYAIVHDTEDWVVRVDLGTGYCETAAHLDEEFWSLTYDPNFDTLVSANTWWDGGSPTLVYLWHIGTGPGSVSLVGSCELAGVYHRVSALAMHTERGLLYGYLESTAGQFQFVEIDPLTADVRLIGPERSEPIEALAYDRVSGMLHGASGLYGSPLLMIDPDTGGAAPIGDGLPSRITGMTAVHRQQDALFYVRSYSEPGAAVYWLRDRIDNEQDGLFLDGAVTHTPPGNQPDPNLGRIDGISLVFETADLEQFPIVAWAQRIDDAYSEILVARGLLWENAYHFLPIGTDAFGVPSNRLPGISRTLRDSTDPVVVIAANGNPVVAWRETVAPDRYEVYARRYVPTEDQWLEIGDFSASSVGVSQSAGTANSFDLAVYQNQLVLAHAHDGYIVLKKWNGSWWDDFTPGSSQPGPDSVSGPDGGADRDPAIAVYPGSDMMLITWTRVMPDGMSVLGRRYAGGYWHTVEHIHNAPQVQHPTTMTTLTGHLVTAWEEEQTTPWSQVLAKYCDNGLWSDIGPGSSSSGGISGSAAPSRYPRLAVGADAHPVIAWEENGLAFVRRFTPSLGADCNSNGVPDSLDVQHGTSADCNGNIVPDECEFYDGNKDGTVNAQDLTPFDNCMLGPQLPPSEPCTEWSDGNCDSAVDLLDYALMQWWSRLTP